jgi:hypothetical protein
VRRDREYYSGDHPAPNNIIPTEKLQRFAVFDNMRLLSKDDIVEAVLQKQEEMLVRKVRATALSPDRQYFDDPDVIWHSIFAPARRTPSYIPFSIACLPKNLHEPWKFPSVSGHLKTESVRVSNIRLKYLHRLAIVVFQIEFEVAFRPYLKEIVVNGEMFRANEFSGSLPSIRPLLLYEIPVPILLLETWLRSKVEDSHAHVFIKDDDIETIEYEILDKRYNFDNIYVRDGRFTYKYPKSFMEWIRYNRLWIFTYLGERECEIHYGIRDTLLKSMNHDIWEARSPSHPESGEQIGQKADLVTEAFKIPSSDRKRLMEIDLVNEALSYSQWAERLWYKGRSKGAVRNFFNRMRRLGLLTVRHEKNAKKNVGSIVVELTPLAKSLLRAIQEHLESPRHY